MSELTLQRNHMNIIYVVKTLVDALTLAIMKQHTPERNPRDIMNVEESSVSAESSQSGETLQPSANTQALQKTQSQAGREAASLYQEEKAIWKLQDNSCRRSNSVK